VDYVHLIYHLLPKGQVWPAGAGEVPVWDALVNAIASEFTRVHADAERIASIWIDIPDEWLEDFERILALDRGALSDSARRTQINTKLAQFAGISTDDYQTIADALKASTTITRGEYPLFRMNVGAMGDAIRGEQWWATMTVTYPGPADPVFEAAFSATIPPNNSVIYVVT
jgi:uncharacterized protein YmfQ (DUF2313 family)